MFTFLAARSIWMRLTEASFELRRQELAHPEIGVHVQRKLLLAGIPAAGPVAGNAEADAKRIDLLTHALILLPVADADGDVTVALDDARAATLGARRKALEHRRGVHVTSDTFSSSMSAP